MTTKQEFSADEWRLITGAPWAVGLAVILAEDQGRRRATQKELAALAAAPAQLAAGFTGNALVQAALPDVIAHAAAEQVKEHSRAKGTVEQEIYKATVDLCKRLATLLHTKAPYVEADGYKRFVLAIGNAVAGAVADAEYLGIGGGTISANERKLLQALGEALDLSE